MDAPQLARTLESGTWILRTRDIIKRKLKNIPGPFSAEAELEQCFPPL
jgi:hypothetical protein